MAVTNAVSWRVDGLKHKKNEVRPCLLHAMHGCPTSPAASHLFSGHMIGTNPCLLPVPACVQVFLDVVESVNLLVSAAGNVLHSEIVGAIKMRVFLSGTAPTVVSHHTVCTACSLVSRVRDAVLIFVRNHIALRAPTDHGHTHTHRDARAAAGSERQGRV